MRRRQRSIWRGDWRSMGWAVLAYGIRPLLLCLRRPQPRDPAFTEPDLFA